MNKKIHELLENNSFSTNDPQIKSEFYQEMYDELKHYTSTLFKEKNFSDSDNLKIQAAFKDDSWRFLSKPFFQDDYIKSYFYMMTMFHKFGKKVFEIDGDLAEALYHTDISIIPSEIHFPFKSFILYIDNSKIKGVSKIDNIFKEYTVEYILVDFIEFNGIKTIRYILGHYDEGTDKTNIKNWNNTTIVDCQLAGEEKLKIKNGVMEHLLPKEISIAEEERLKKTNEVILNFILSFILYITLRPDDNIEERPKNIIIKTSKPKKIKKMMKELENESEYIIHYIGKKYSGIFKQHKIYANIHEIELNHKIIVRGHWRLQWYGKRIEENYYVPGQFQKLIWIEPFYKGKEFEESNKTNIYRVQ